MHSGLRGQSLFLRASSSSSVDSSSELVLVDVLCEHVEVVLVDGPWELVVDRICPPIAISSSGT